MAVLAVPVGLAPHSYKPMDGHCGALSVRTSVWAAVFVKGNVVVTAHCHFKELQMTMFLSIQS